MEREAFPTLREMPIRTEAGEGGCGVVGAAAGEVSGVRPPDVRIYFVRLREDMKAKIGSPGDVAGQAGEDELVWINSFALNAKFYASTGEKRAFVLSHGKDLLVLKLVG